MTIEEITHKADSFFEFPTEKRDCVTFTSAVLFAKHCAEAAEINVERLREELRSWKMVTTDTNSVVMLKRCEQLQAEVGRLEEIEQYWRNETTQALERAEAAEAEVERLRECIISCLNDNGHLADGDNCTLIALKKAVPDWEITP